jgi:hypothetical protein
MLDELIELKEKGNAIELLLHHRLEDDYNMHCFILSMVNM